MNMVDKLASTSMLTSQGECHLLPLHPKCLFPFWKMVAVTPVGAKGWRLPTKEAP